MKVCPYINHSKVILKGLGVFCRRKPSTFCDRRVARQTMSPSNRASNIAWPSSFKTDWSHEVSSPKSSVGDFKPEGEHQGYLVKH